MAQALPLSNEPNSAMKSFRIFSLFLLLLLASMAFGQDVSMKSYCNSRFQFCVKFPADFGQPQESGNGDGAIMLSVDKKAELRAFGSNAFEGFDKLTDEFKTATSDIKLTYKVIKPNWFVFSGTDRKGMIVYRKTAKRKVSDPGSDAYFVFQTICFTYPPQQSQIYQQYCAYIASSLKE
jgi:hypothetical protein